MSDQDNTFKTVLLIAGVSTATVTVAIAGLFGLGVMFKPDRSPTAQAGVNRQTNASQAQSPATPLKLVETSPTSKKSPTVTPPKISTPNLAPTPESTPEIKDQRIKGNRNSKIYHFPWCPSYDRMKDKNVIWFKTAEEAEAAGFRMARNC